MEQTILNRLIAARHIIESSGPTLTGSPPSLLLAQKLLIAHDAAELVLTALSTFPGAAPLGRDGQLIKDPSFMDLSRAVVHSVANAGGAGDRLQLKLLQDLTEARKLFKHSGIIVDPVQNSHLFPETVAILDQLCAGITGTHLLKVDSISIISDVGVREHFRSGKALAEAGDYKEVLERIAWGLARSFSSTEFTVGKPSSKTRFS